MNKKWVLPSAWPVIVAVFIFIPAFTGASSEGDNDLKAQWQISEDLKEHYKKQNWDQFFGLAQYFRKKWPKANDPSTRLLEALALLRHCQSEPLETLLQELFKNFPERKLEIGRIEALSKSIFKGKKASKEAPSALMEHFTGTSLQKRSHNELKEIPPERIRIKVENKC